MNRIAIQKLHLLAIFVLFTLLSGCHSNAKKPEEPEQPPQPSTLRTISINSNVVITTDPTYSSPSGQTATFLAGPLAGLAMRAATSNADALKILAESKDVDLRDLAVSNFREQLVRAGSPFTLVEKDAEAELQIEIEEYGLIVSGASAMQPIISINAKLVKPDGREIWSDSESHSHPFMSGVSTQTWQNYVATPSLLKTSFNEIIKATTTEIVDSLFDDHRNGEIEE